MGSHNTKSDLLHSTACASEQLFADWFDPIEMGVRTRVRSFIEELIEAELEEALSRPRYGRAARSEPGYGDVAPSFRGHRHGRRSRTLMGVEFCWTLDKIRRWFGCHHRNARLPALVPQNTDQRGAVLWLVEIVNLTEPARQIIESAKARPPYRRDRLTLLARQPDLAAYHRAGKRHFRDNKHEMLQRP